MSTMRHTSTGVNVLRLMQANGTIRAAIGKKDPYAVKSVKLLAQATGEYTKAELNKDATLGWTKAAQQLIDAAKTPAP